MRGQALHEQNLFKKWLILFSAVLCFFADLAIDAIESSDSVLACISTIPTEQFYFAVSACQPMKIAIPTRALPITQLGYGKLRTFTSFGVRQSLLFRC